MNIDSSSIGKGNGSLTFWREKKLGETTFCGTHLETQVQIQTSDFPEALEIRVHVDLQKEVRPMRKAQEVSSDIKKNNRFPSGP